MKLVDTHMDLTKKTFESFALNTYKVNNFEFIQGLRYEKVNLMVVEEIQMMFQLLKEI